MIYTKLHRIFTEYKNIEAVKSIVSKAFEGFTFFTATGYWRGIAEPSLVIEIVTDETDKFYQLARDIKAYNKQESVLVELISNHSDFV